MAINPQALDFDWQLEKGEGSGGPQGPFGALVLPTPRGEDLVRAALVMDLGAEGATHSPVPRYRTNERFRRAVVHAFRIGEGREAHQRIVSLSGGESGEHVLLASRSAPAVLEKLGARFGGTLYTKVAFPGEHRWDLPGGILPHTGRAPDGAWYRKAEELLRAQAVARSVDSMREIMKGAGYGLDTSDAAMWRVLQKAAVREQPVYADIVGVALQPAFAAMEEANTAAWEQDGILAMKKAAFRIAMGAVVQGTSSSDAAEEILALGKMDIRRDEVAEMVAEVRERVTGDRREPPAFLFETAPPGPRM